MSARQRHPEFWETLFANALPKTHLYAAAALALGLTLLLVIAPSEDVSAYRDANLLEIQIPSTTSLYEDLKEKNDAVSAEQPEDLDQLTWRVQKIKSGDNLSSLFSRLGLSQSEVYVLANAGNLADEFKRIRPGETLAVGLDDEQRVAEVIYERSTLESYRFLRTTDGYDGAKIARKTEKSSAFSHVTIQHSLFVDGKNAGLSHGLIMELARVFAWDIDFALDIRRGDTFTLVYEEESLDGEKVRDGNLLAAEFINQGRLYQAVRYVDSNGNAGYYTPQGHPMRKAFLRAPLDFTRVSSNFNPNRLHPIFKTPRPHRGVDYAASTGTPVYAAGNGKVIESGYKNSNGNYVVIRHNGRYTTKYLHLHKRSVKRGETVKQGDLIGTVGSTGYATGPHLHYEFLVNGAHTNPRTVALPKADPISRQEMARFIDTTAPLFTQLASFRTQQLAYLSQ
ncbi:MAG: peptidase M23 [Porticoccaceae bacterium]|nr:peptidase M23 [Porticoccaceae bacterium]